MLKKSHIKINKQVFTEAYESHWRELYITCSHYIKDTESAKEIVQDVFISIWERREAIIIHTSLKGYLYSALKLKVLEYHRNKAVKDNYIQFKIQTDPFPSSDVTEEDVLHKQLSVALNTAVKSLPERCQEVYVMSRREGIDNKSIALVLQISEKAVEGNMTRAISFIRKRLKAFKH